MCSTQALAAEYRKYGKLGSTSYIPTGTGWLEENSSSRERHSLIKVQKRRQLASCENGVHVTARRVVTARRGQKSAFQLPRGPESKLAQSSW